jgi:hypothetical protein
LYPYNNSVPLLQSVTIPSGVTPIYASYPEDSTIFANRSWIGPSREKQILRYDITNPTITKNPACPIEVSTIPAGLLGITKIIERYNIAIITEADIPRRGYKYAIRIMGK